MSRILCGGLAFALGIILPPAVPARVSDAASAGAAPAASSGAPVLPANAVIELEMVDAVGSETSHPGDLFKMRVAAPVVWGGQVLVPAGTQAMGQVVHAQKARGGGKGGELILAARYLELSQGQVKLHSTFGAAGANRVNASMALAYAVGPFAMMVKGKAVAMPAGATLSARVAVDTPILGAPGADASPSSSTTTDTRN